MIKEFFETASFAKVAFEGFMWGLTLIFFLYFFLPKWAFAIIMLCGAAGVGTFTVKGNKDE